MTIKYDLKKIRKDLGMTQAEFAKKIGMSESWVGKAERGERKINNCTANSILSIKITCGITKAYRAECSSETEIFTAQSKVQAYQIALEKFGKHPEVLDECPL